MKPKIKFHRRKMEISTGNGEVARYYSDLVYVKYKESYCWLHFHDDADYKVDVTLKYLLKNIPEKAFFKCSRAGVINICRYKAYQEKPAMVIMDDGEIFGLSVRNIADFKKQKAGLERISPPCPLCPDCKNENCPDFGLFCRPFDAENDGEE